ncbi:MAG: hypothetical protein D6768_19145 [Chloroflexi bacterium]|nr:MAG: hypothetical protein D6768_19145 [Chloroflexota bacterium]
MKDNTDKRKQYHIKIQGQLGVSWQDWFEGLTIELTDDGDTILSGMIADQAALYGILKKIHNLGLTLISVINHAKGEKP